MYHIRRFCLYVAKGGRVEESVPPSSTKPLRDPRSPWRSAVSRMFSRFIPVVECITPLCCLQTRSRLATAHPVHPALSCWVLGLCPPFESDAAWQVRVPAPPFTSSLPSFLCSLSRPRGTSVSDLHHQGHVQEEEK